jgi:hypothetical protein
VKASDAMRPAAVLQANGRQRTWSGRSEAHPAGRAVVSTEGSWLSPRRICCTPSSHTGVVSPYETSRLHMALVSLRPRVVSFFEVFGLGGREARLDEMAVEEGSPLVGRIWRRRVAPRCPFSCHGGTGRW